MPGKDVLGMADLGADGIGAVLELARRMKAGEDTTRYLAGKNVGLLFNVPSTRTRVSFQVAASQLGADSHTYGVEELRLANRETVEDTAGVLARYLDALVVRWYDMDDYGGGHRRLEAMAAAADIPVVNALDDLEHPCQVLGDLLTLRELLGPDLAGRRVVYTWAYSSRQKTPGVLHSSMLAGALLGLRFTFVHPEHFGLDRRFTEEAARIAAGTGAEIVSRTDLEGAVSGADAVYVQSWKSFELAGQDEWQARTRLAARWRVTEELMERAGPDAVFLDCMPSNRGEEVDADVKDGPRSRIFQQAENRLHVQKALLARLLSERARGEG
ncbi:ornithine carbamoyltransferase [Amycolatopsis sp. OK19-0408]|uniref:Ornithine carbamoyltransferase n=1 Tax=Amycolatopsis iheyensis TaxID=2945988 RepID=A0A9X2SJI0_9PSEU|nr:ornithine carbamoyltransferase [Amycolatopsis iheyensis]MCR6482861.1 ornithine carbamoyltransferase [Amycolatopsis iheyensis]